jgi:hypothetical protein
MSLLTKIWMRPETSWMLAKLALPITRFNMMRPATLTSIGVASSSSRVFAL